jgi:AraC-like DNA-binding protein
MKPQACEPTWLISLRVPPEVHAVDRIAVATECLGGNFHKMFWVLALVDYDAEFAIDEHVISVHPGTVAIFPPGSACTVRFTRRSEQIHAFFTLAAGRGDEIPIPCLTDLGPDPTPVRSQLEAARSSYLSEPKRASLILHELLRQLATMAPRLNSAHLQHPALRDAVAFIQANLHEPLTVTAIAQHAGISERQLLTHFRRQFNTTVVAYVRRCRAERARTLLLATDLPAKAVAAQIGIGDLQRFNKTIRREYGTSPRTIRTAKLHS